MRLFLVAVGLWGLSGCQKVAAGAGAVRVEVSYATFRPGCLSVTAVDAADASHTQTQQLPVEERRSANKTVAVFRQPDWGRTLVVTASAREDSCTGLEVATQSTRVEVPERGASVAYLDLRAEDLDADGFVAQRNGGSDCDDTDATVHPGIPETCDGQDTNCSGDERDATDTRTWFTDGDGDGYGNPRAPVQSCVQPVGTVANDRDCLDSDPGVHPDQDEPLCDGLDDNCDGRVDEAFHVGEVCQTEQQCTGARECTGDQKASRCRSPDVPKTWYRDEDGDGRYGSELPVATCQQPASTSPLQNDCDDTSRFRGGLEVCDRLDNDCDGAVDEEGVCAATAWSSSRDEDVPWRAVAAYAPDKAWRAGDGGRLVRREGASEVNAVTFCSGLKNWTAAWARKDGRVFLGTDQGELATTTALGGCVGGTPGDTTVGRITGMVGFESGGSTTVYAVTASGQFLRWNWKDPPASQTGARVVAQVAASLRGVHGASADTLLAVGAEDYQVGGKPLPRIFRFDTASSTWSLETLPADTGPGFLNAVSEVDGTLAYAVGDAGLVLQWSGGGWRKVAAPGGAPDLTDVLAFHPTVVYALSHRSPRGHPPVQRLGVERTLRSGAAPLGARWRGARVVVGGGPEWPGGALGRALSAG